MERHGAGRPIAHEGAGIVPEHGQHDAAEVQEGRRDVLDSGESWNRRGLRDARDDAFAARQGAWQGTPQARTVPSCSAAMAVVPEAATSVTPTSPRTGWGRSRSLLRLGLVEARVVLHRPDQRRGHQARSALQVRCVPARVRPPGTGHAPIHGGDRTRRRRQCRVPPQQCLCFLPLPQGHGALRPTRGLDVAGRVAAGGASGTSGRDRRTHCVRNPRPISA